MIRRNLLLMVFMMLPLFCCGQVTMERVWKQMPDSLVPYLNESRRTTMADFFKMGEKAEVYHSLDGGSLLDTLTATYARVSLSEALRLDLMLLPLTGGDTIVCEVRTYLGEAGESKVSFFDTDWQRLPTSDYLPEVSFTDLVIRPDTMSQEEFDHLCLYFEPQLIAATLQPDDSSLTFSLSMPLTSKADRQRLEAIRLQRKFNWDGKMYK